MAFVMAVFLVKEIMWVVMACIWNLAINSLVTAGLLVSVGCSDSGSGSSG